MKVTVNGQSVTPLNIVNGSEIFTAIWDMQPGVDYMLAVYDIFAPYPNNRTSSPYLHQLRVNISTTSPGVDVVPYVGFTPPDDSPPHLYIFAVYQQNFQFATNVTFERKGFNIDSLSNFGKLVDKETIQAVSYKNMEFQRSQMLPLSPGPFSTSFQSSGPSVPPTFSAPSLTFNAPVSPNYGVPVGSFPMIPLSPQTGAIIPLSPTVATSQIPISTHPVPVPVPMNIPSSTTSSHAYGSHSHPGTQYFPDNTSLTEREQAYCRCVRHVGKAHVNPDGSTDRDRDVNPYAVCHSRIHVGNPPCGENMILDNLPDAELIGFAHDHKIQLSYPYDRAQALAAIHRVKG